MYKKTCARAHRVPAHFGRVLLSQWASLRRESGMLKAQIPWWLVERKKGRCTHSVYADSFFFLV
jgi:hypothetical protein